MTGDAVVAVSPARTPTNNVLLLKSESASEIESEWTLGEGVAGKVTVSPSERPCV